MSTWLVEEHAQRPSVLDGEETITFHKVVGVPDTTKEPWKTAFVTAARYCDHAFYFDMEELKEWVPGYCWAAADGSSVCYEVRLLDRIK
jgi:hypothetical protein